MRRILPAIVLSGSFLTACSVPHEPLEPQSVQRTELIVLRQSTYSDAALIEEEEGTYIGLPQAVSPFSIMLSFRDADTGQRKLLHTVYFKTDSATLGVSEKHRLSGLAPILRRQGVTLSGYADPRAGTEYNNRLATRRVANVTRHLKQLGVTVNRDCIFGESRLPDSDLCEWRTQ